MTRTSISIPGFAKVNYIFVPTVQHAVKAHEFTCHYDKKERAMVYKEITRTRSKN